jgi:uncharacterized protein HemY
VPLTEYFGEYVAFSHAVLVDVPAGRFRRAEQPLVQWPEEPAGAGSRMLWLELAGGLALRRGDLDAAGRHLLRLRDLALESDETQRVVPMAGVVLPLALVRDDLELLRRVGTATLGYLERHWDVMSVTPIARALAATGSLDLLHRLGELVVASAPGGDNHRRVAAGVVEGLLAAARGDAGAAVAALEAATESERRRGWAYRAACLDVELARVLAEAGRDGEAEGARARAAAVLDPLGIVNPY